MPLFDSILLYRTVVDDLSAVGKRRTRAFKRRKDRQTQLGRSYAVLVVPIPIIIGIGIHGGSSVQFRFTVIGIQFRFRRGGTVFERHFQRLELDEVVNFAIRGRF